ncbi:MAG: hypothetical protein AAB879_00545 [Patescibacteria group bacterium]
MVYKNANGINKKTPQHSHLMVVWCVPILAQDSGVIADQLARVRMVSHHPRLKRLIRIDGYQFDKNSVLHKAIHAGGNTFLLKVDLFRRYLWLGWNAIREEAHADTPEKKEGILRGALQERGIVLPPFAPVYEHENQPTLLSVAWNRIANGMVPDRARILREEQRTKDRLRRNTQGDGEYGF